MIIDWENIDSLVITSKSGEVVCILTLDGKSILYNGYDAHVCADMPKFKVLHGKIYYEGFEAFKGL